jgi:ketosteroid isomerase-like protein
MRRLAVLLVGVLSLLTVRLPAQPPGAWQSLVDAERAFAADSVKSTIREAFITHLHPQSILFSPAPVNGIELYTSRPARPGQLAWAPEVVDVSASGDFGYSTGPHQFRRTADSEVLRQGYFCSIWVRSASTPWKVLIDLGTSQPMPVSLDVTPRDPTPAPAVSAGAKAAATLAQAERQFAQAVAGDQVATYRALLARHARVYRDGGAPTEGVLQALDAIAKRGRLVRVTPEKTDVATSGDMGYAYGRLELADASADAAPIYYVRVWRHDTQGWRVVLDVDTWAAAR